MNKKIFKGRFTPKGDIEANWNKAVGFIPLEKEIIIYKPDETHPVARIKIGDGVTTVQALPFSGTDMEAVQQLINEKGQLLVKYVDNAVAGLASEEYVDEKIAAIDIKQPMVYVTWAELKELRDNSQLVSGQFYRITDYVCTTAQEGTRAMDHQFDIIVQALSANQLSESASADYHEGDDYFISSESNTIIDSNIITEQVETILEEGDVEWLYDIFEDIDDVRLDYDGVANKSHPNDSFVAFDFLENNNGIVVPVLYKNDMTIDKETGEPAYGLDDIDYGDQYFYVGEQEIDGIIYDKWRKIEPQAVGIDPWNTAGKFYALTNKIVGEGLLIEATFTYGAGRGQKIANLSAWELKYCLDNNTNRFAWADDCIMKGFKCTDDGVSIYVYTRYPEADTYGLFAWAFVNNTPIELKDYSDVPNWTDINLEDLIFTETETISDGDSLHGGDYYAVGEMYVQAGKGVIYWMKDEWNNECPYDFKNIQFKRYMITEVSETLIDSTLMGHYLGLPDGHGYSVNESDYLWCYTFSWLNKHNVVEDSSVVGQYLKNDEGQYTGVYDNIIKCISNYEMTWEAYLQSFKIDLNNIVFLSEYSYSGGDFFGCCANTFGTICGNNTFGNNCSYNIFSNNCKHNTFDNSCSYNTFGNSCSYNTFSNDCSDNAFDCACSSNTFDYSCHYNVLGIACSHNTFGKDCMHNTFGDHCYNNAFGRTCNYNTFGNGCNCISIQEDYVKYINVTEGCCFIKFVNDENSSDENLIQNITIGQGVHGSNYKNPLQLHVSRNAAPVIFRAKNTTEIILD